MSFNQAFTMIRLSRNYTSLAYSLFNRGCKFKQKFSYLQYYLSKRRYLCTYVEKENNYAYHIVATDNLGSTVNGTVTNISNEHEFNTFMEQNWRNSNSTDIANAFVAASRYCKEHQINLSDTRFDSLVDGLMDHCQNLTDMELLELLRCLSEYPRCHSYLAHNFHDVWSCLDDMCCWRIPKWNVETLITFADTWYKLQMAKYSDFIYEILDNLGKKTDKLTKEQLLHLFFLFNISRRRHVHFEYEYAIEKYINEMNVDQMAVIALGYFKTKSKIKLLPISQAMIKGVTNSYKDIHEISLTAIMKILRFSQPPKVLSDIQTMLEKLYPELDRFSNVCCLHIALILTAVVTPNYNILNKVSEILFKDIKTIRLKEIERILNVLSMFNYHPKTVPRLYEKAFEELHKDYRSSEIESHPRPFLSALHYLSLQGIYSYSYLDNILDAEYIKLKFGKSAKSVPRELFSLDCSIDIDCPDYKGNRLPPHLKYKAVKWLTDFIPSPDQWTKITLADRLFIDAVEVLKKIVKNEDFIFLHHVLPHFQSGVIVVCKNIETDQFVKPKGFENYILGDIMVPFNDGSLKWYAIMIVGYNNTIKETSVPLGHMLMKERQLKKIGYTPRMVIWNQFMPLTAKEKERYISSMLL